MSKNFGKKSQSAQLQCTTTNVPFYCLEKSPIGTPISLLLVEEGEYVKIGLGDDEIGHIE